MLCLVHDLWKKEVLDGLDAGKRLDHHDIFAVILQAGVSLGVEPLKFQLERLCENFQSAQPASCITANHLMNQDWELLKL